jgi:CubicO group peptidase (beta-lactamase class C family)
MRIRTIMFLPLLLAGCMTAETNRMASPELSMAERDALYNQRFDSMLTTGGEMASYSPTEPVPGAAGSPSLPVAAANERSISQAALDEARRYAGANNSNAFIVWRDGKVQTADYFGGAGAETPIVSKSLAKPVTAVAVGRAIMLGKIRSLDQPVADFITEWKGTPKQAMLIRHLLDMRTGLLAQGFSTDRDNPWARAYLDPDHGRYIVEQYPLTDTPGSIYEYSNATSDLVALVIERATGRRYAEFVGNEVLKPIGAPGGEVWINRPGGLAHSGCCMMLPAQSWLRLGTFLLSDGKVGNRRLLPENYVREMRTATPQNPYYGMGLWVGGRYIDRRGFGNPNRPGPKVLHSEPYLADDIFMFDGNSNQLVYVIPSERMVILRTGATPPKSPEWDNAKLPNMLLRGIIRKPGEPAPRPQPRG